MTLLELLRQELDDWPEWCVCMTQDEDLYITLWDHTNITTAWFRGSLMWDEPLPCNGGTSLSKELNDYQDYAQVLSLDYATAIITKEMYYDTNL